MTATRSDLAAAIERLKDAHVLCVGDVMLDRYVYGAVERISPEAPIPVLRMEREAAMLGGAGNVVRNLSALGAHVAFASVVGNDQAGREISALVAGVVNSDKFRDKFAARGLVTRYEAPEPVMRKLDDIDGRVAPMIKAMSLSLV